MDADEEFYKDAEDAVSKIDEEPKKKKPWMFIAAVFILLVFILSAFPLYSIKVNPPPDMDAIEDFKLTQAEKEKLGEIEYEGTSSIQDAINQINVGDYREITVRLVTSACSTRSELCYAKAIYYYVQDIQYVSDPQTRQYVQSPAETLLSRGLDCEDASLLVSVLAESIGIDVDVGTTHDHAFVRAQLPDSPFWLRQNSDYVWLDPTSTLGFGEINFKKSDVVQFFEVA